MIGDDLAATGVVTMAGGAALLLVAGLFFGAAFVRSRGLRRTMQVVGVIIVVVVVGAVVIVWGTTSAHVEPPALPVEGRLHFGAMRVGVGIALGAAVVAIVGTILCVRRSGSRFEQVDAELSRS